MLPRLREMCNYRKSFRHDWIGYPHLIQAQQVYNPSSIMGDSFFSEAFHKPLLGGLSIRQDPTCDMYTIRNIERNNLLRLGTEMATTPLLNKIVFARTLGSQHPGSKPTNHHTKLRYW